MNSCFKVRQVHQERTETVFHYHSNNGKMPKGSKPRMQRKVNVSKSVCGSKLQTANTHTVLSSQLCWAPPPQSREHPWKNREWDTKKIAQPYRYNGKKKKIKDWKKKKKRLEHGHPFWNYCEVPAQMGNWRLMFQILFATLKEHFHLWSSAAGNDHQYSQRLQNNYGKNTLGGLVGLGFFSLF